MRSPSYVDEGKEHPDHLFPLDPAVPAVIIVGAVRIAPSVSLIVLRVIGIQVIQAEAVMAGQEIDGSIASAPFRRIKVR